MGKKKVSEVLGKGMHAINIMGRKGYDSVVGTKEILRQRIIAEVGGGTYINNDGEEVEAPGGKWVRVTKGGKQTAMFQDVRDLDKEAFKTIFKGDDVLLMSTIKGGSC
jgi:hypothetical protein